MAEKVSDSKISVIMEGVRFLDNKVYTSQKNGSQYNSIYLEDDHGRHFELKLEQGVPFPALMRNVMYRIVVVVQLEEGPGFRLRMSAVMPLDVVEL
jgi:hypothetical protein